MANSSLTNDSSNTPGAQVEGVTKIRQMTIAAMIARGFSVKYVHKKLKMSESRIYHLLSDKDSLVNAEIKRIFNDLFASADRQLINLYNKALQKLDAMLSSSDEEKQYRAMDRIIKMFFARIAKNTIIQQYFGDQPKQREFTIDDYILFGQKLKEMAEQRRKERGLDRSPDDGVRPDSSPEDSFRDNSSTDDSPRDASPNDSSPDASFPDPSSPEYKAFVDSIVK
jgi:hypothetical protein